MKHHTTRAAALLAALALCAAAPASAEQKTFTGMLTYIAQGECLFMVVQNETRNIEFCCGKHENQCRAWDCEKLGQQITVRYDDDIEEVSYEAQSIEWPAAPFDRELNQALCAASLYHHGSFSPRRQKHAETIRRMGEWYEHGQHGLPKNAEQALGYYKMAAENSIFLRAQENLDNLCKQLREKGQQPYDCKFFFK